jgi:predicted tellurium resistance membrane protein TerC
MTLDWVIPVLTLTAMEIVLGIDNIVFLTILVGKLPPEQQRPARLLGLALALGLRLGLLFMIRLIMGLTAPVFYLTSLGVPEGWVTEEALNAVSWRDIILIVGGMFLIGKSTYEIHDKLEGGGDSPAKGGLGSSFFWVIAQIIILDLVFSIDSVITAVGMAQEIWVMVTAMVIAVGVMLVSAGAIGNFVHRHPTLKMLALSFLILIGVMLMAEGIEKHINRGYIYFAMAFALGVELLNMRVRVKGPAVELREPVMPEPKAGA